MNTFLSHKITLFVSRIVLGFIFVIASIDKIAIPELFASNVSAYQLIPFPLVNIFSVIIPWIELICGLFLLAGVRVRAASAIIIALLFVFIAAIMISMARELNIDCGCFGTAHATPVGWERVIEDVGMLLLSLQIFFFTEEKVSEINQTAMGIKPIA